MADQPTDPIDLGNLSKKAAKIFGIPMTITAWWLTFLTEINKWGRSQLI